MAAAPAPPASSVLTVLKSAAASLMRENSTQKACTSTQRLASPTETTLLRNRLCWRRERDDKTEDRRGREREHERGRRGRREEKGESANAKRGPQRAEMGRDRYRFEVRDPTSAGAILSPQRLCDHLSLAIALAIALATALAIARSRPLARSNPAPGTRRAAARAGSGGTCPSPPSTTIKSGYVHSV